MNKCNQSGVCCKLFLVNINEEEYLSGKFETELEEFEMMNFSEAEMCGANILKRKKDGSCIYLKNKKCSIHKTRPLICREFFCNSKKEQYQDMIRQVNEVKRRML